MARKRQQTTDQQREGGARDLPQTTDEQRDTLRDISETDFTAIGPNIGVFNMVVAADPLATALGIRLAAADDAGRNVGAGGR